MSGFTSRAGSGQSPRCKMPVSLWGGVGVPSPCRAGDGGREGAWLRWTSLYSTVRREQALLELPPVSLFLKEGDVCVCSSDMRADYPGVLAEKKDYLLIFWLLKLRKHWCSAGISQLSTAEDTDPDYFSTNPGLFEAKYPMQKLGFHQFVRRSKKKPKIKCRGSPALSGWKHRSERAPGCVSGTQCRLTGTEQDSGWL